MCTNFKVATAKLEVKICMCVTLKFDFVKPLYDSTPPPPPPPNHSPWAVSLPHLEQVLQVVHHILYEVLTLDLLQHNVDDVIRERDLRHRQI